MSSQEDSLTTIGNLVDWSDTEMKQFVDLPTPMRHQARGSRNSHPTHDNCEEENTTSISDNANPLSGQILENQPSTSTCVIPANLAPKHTTEDLDLTNESLEILSDISLNEKSLLSHLPMMNRKLKLLSKTIIFNLRYLYFHSMQVNILWHAFLPKPRIT